ncbi:MAG TPA: 1,2-phenylacetyl-CoA epoxidase subunit PaaD [Micromonosporaceae bacterium]
MTTVHAPADRAAEVVAAVPDPELPMVTIADLGILRGVEVSGTGRVTVTITPTYSGCPAMDTIRTDIRRALTAAGWPDVEVRTQLAPAWTTDWMTQEAKHKLAEAGIAPPEPHQDGGPVPVRLSMRCPNCGSPDTSEISRFGATSCKSLWRCRSCAEPFEHFKAL